MTTATLLHRSRGQQGCRPSGSAIGSWTLAITLAGCGSPTTPPVQGTTQDTTVETVVEVQKVPASAFDESVRQEIDQYAFAMFHLQRVNVLKDRSVQLALKLTAEQIERFSALKREVETLIKELATLSPTEMESRLKSDLLPKAESYRDLLDQELNAEQQQTVRREVLKRQRGAITFLLPGVPEELELSQEQKDAIYQTVDETRQMIEGKNLNNPLEIYRLSARGTAARKATEERLTPEQRARWQSLLKDD